MNTYLNNILMLNVSDPANLKLKFDLLKSVPNITTPPVNQGNTTDVQNYAFFLLVNGLRDLRTKSDDSITF